METSLRFIISLFGDRHVGMLLPLLYSIQKSNPDASVSVYWEDISLDTVRLMQTAFPTVDWVKTNFNFSSDITKRISSKMLVWNQAAQEKCVTEKDWLLFLDADMLVRKDILSFLKPIKSDAVLTYREGPFPINSGVVIFRAGNKSAHFFQSWLDKTLEILSTPELYAQANNKHLPYGGADQMALHLILDYETSRREYQNVLSDGQSLSLEMQHCEDLNETYSVPITDRTRIIHYKGGWRSILFENGPFTRNRSKKDSWDMFVYYHQTYREALTFFDQKTGLHSTAERFGLTTPFFFNPVNGKFYSTLYLLHLLLWQITNFLPRLRRYAVDQVRRFRKSFTQKSE